MLADGSGVSRLRSGSSCPSCLYFRELDAQQSLRGLGVQAERGQSLAGAAVGKQDSQQQVLSSDVIVPKPQRGLQRASERRLAARGEAQLAQGRRVLVLAGRRRASP